MVEKMRETTPVKTEKKKDSDAKNESPNRGKLIIDATWGPADITRGIKIFSLVREPTKIVVT